METVKLALVTLGLLAVIVGFFFLAFTLLGKNKGSEANCETDVKGSTRAFGCGCGAGACGLPADRSVK